MRSGADHQKFWGKLRRESGKGGSSVFLDEDGLEIGSSSSSFAHGRMGSLGRMSSSFLRYSDSRDTVSQRGSRTSRGSLYFGEGMEFEV